MLKGPRHKIPASVLAGLALAIVLDTVIQALWKIAAVGGGVLSSPYFYAAMAAFAAQLLNWLRVLARADLSFAQPFTAISYVTVLAFSSRFLHEAMPASKLAGVALILLGVFFISRTPAKTGAAGSPQ
jgi:drug/metabolite transporter (DMT)-like permease